MAANFGVDDYTGCCGCGPGPYCNACAGSFRSDVWGEGCGQCTSFVDHRLSQAGLPVLRGNASDFPAAAAAHGWAVDGSFRAHDIVYLPPGCHGAGPVGHVAIALSADAGGVTVEQFNFCTNFASECNCLSGWCRYSHLRFDFTGCGMRAIHPPWPGGPPPPPPDPCAGVSCPPCFACSGGVCQGGCPTNWTCAGNTCLPPGTPPPATPGSGALVGLLLLGGAAGLAVYAARAHPAEVSRATAWSERHLRPGNAPGFAPGGPPALATRPRRHVPVSRATRARGRRGGPHSVR